jgi:Rrf2 family protein
MRLQLTKRTDYAIRACLLLAAESRCPIPGRRIAEQMRIPDRFLPQVMADLGRAGIVTATNGKHGGYCLSRDPASLSLLEVVESVERTDRRPSGLLAASCDAGPGWAIHPVWGEAQAAFVDVLAGASIAELAARRRAPEGIGLPGPERTEQ